MPYILLMKFLAFFGHLNIDVQMSVPKLPGYGESVSVKSVSENFAGTAGNFAFVANSLGLKFDLYSAVSKNTHSEFIKILKDRKINVNHIKIYNEDFGPICYLPSDGNEQIAYMYQGPIYKWNPTDHFEYDNYEYLHIGTGPADEYIKIVDKNSKSKVIFDPGQEIWYVYDKEKAIEMVNKSYIIIMNNKEFNYLLKLTGKTKDEILDNVKYIIVTQGKNGTVLYSKNNDEHFPSLKASNIYDTIGAGDSFIAGFYSSIFNNYSIEDSVIIGNITASYAIRSKIIEFNMNYDEILHEFNRFKNKIYNKKSI